MSRFFIDRPVAANVLAWLTVLIGIVAFVRLPIERYPPIVPPTVQVRASYPGASAQVVADTVASPIEQQVNGVEGMLYLSSTSASDGSYALTITFEVGTDLDLAQVQVQNRVAIAEPLLPEDVRRQGLSTKKQSTSILLVVSLTSPDGSVDDVYLSNYATLSMRDELGRVEGVGDVTVIGGGAYAMRVWIDPERLAARGLTTQDVVVALREQNVQVAAGALGQPPARPGQAFQYTLTTLGRLSEPAQFEGIVVKVDAEGRATTLADVARVELGAQGYGTFASRDGIPSASILVYQLPGANALAVAERVHAVAARLGQDFPAGVEYAIPFDATVFVEKAASEVYRTLLEAGALVLLVILVFLQNWRALLIPATTVPVTLIGTFAFMAALGFSINLLTLFGLVLAIGIVVDDAIVIVENAVHHIERGQTPREATIRAMREVTGPVIGITAVLMAVFLPAAFLGGVTGPLYRQFALTIAGTALISALNALTLKPAQCARWLKPVTGEKGAFARLFERVYGPLERAYAAVVARVVGVVPLVLLAFVALVALTAWGYRRLPTSFLPSEDQGYVIVNAQLPDSSSLARTRALSARINSILGAMPGVRSWFVLGGFSLLDGTNASNAATSFIIFDDWSLRARAGLDLKAMTAQLGAEFGAIQEGIVLALVPPAIQGLGVGGGFQLQIEDRGALGREALASGVQELLVAAARTSELGLTFSTFRSGVPQVFVDVDRVQAKQLGLQLGDVFGTLQAALGSLYVNDFNKFGRTYQVRVQADSEFRMEPDDVQRLFVRNQQDEMVPLGAVATVEPSFGPETIARYNLYPSAAVTGSAAPGRSSGEALAKIEELAAATLPRGLDFEWTGMSFQEKRVGGQVLWVFVLAVVLVYLVLAFLYESWLLPLAVILVVPLGLLGSVAALALRGLENNVYTQIGMVLIIALASKNAILIVEFARALRRGGQSIRAASIAAAR
ncbi:MAG: efflux RND transporter permease subunit, partial [Planctomycetes bacterium]|nr:efflux RND transporter permease subunit [Planctomycetota bacterium]